jgi:hypothetical protein
MMAKTGKTFHWKMPFTLQGNAVYGVRIPLLYRNHPANDRSWADAGPAAPSIRPAASIGVTNSAGSGLLKK